MKPLLLLDDGWQVVTAAWTVAAKGNDAVKICYAWSDWGFLDCANGMAHCRLNMSMAQFLEACRVATGPFVDLRAWS